MGERDDIGRRGEIIFSARITNFCGRGVPYFRPYFLGEKAQTLDFLVELVDAEEPMRFFFAQVRTTRKGYTRKERRLKVGLSAGDVRRFARMPAPTYLVGIDEPGEIAYCLAILTEREGPIASLSTAFPLDCIHLPRLYQEVNGFWSGRDMTRRFSVFSV